DRGRGWARHRAPRGWGAPRRRPRGGRTEGGRVRPPPEENRRTALGSQPIANLGLVARFLTQWSAVLFDETRRRVGAGADPSRERSSPDGVILPGGRFLDVAARSIEVVVPQHRVHGRPPVPVGETRLRGAAERGGAEARLGHVVQEKPLVE